VAILAAAVFLGRWVSRAREKAAEAPGDGTPDSCWKLGLFYYNPDDSALFVEKRSASATRSISRGRQPG